MNIGKKIVELRKQKDFTTNKLANVSGISQSYLREVEMGKKNPTVEMLSYICYGLGITLKEFFNDENEKINPVLLSAISKLNDNEQLKLAEFINSIDK